MNNEINHHSTHTTRAFTLIELILTMAIGLFTAGMIVSVAIPAMRTMRTIQASQRLQTNTIFFANALTHWVKQAEYMRVPDSSTLEIMLPDSSIKTITKDGTHITLDGTPLTTDDVQVNELLFTQLDRSVRVTYILEAKKSGETFSITTTVAQRNIP
jgi:Tfp pilus assembly protein PilW